MRGGLRRNGSGQFGGRRDLALSWPDRAGGAQAGGELQAVGVPVAGAFGERLRDDLVNLGRQLGPQLARGRRGRGDLRPHDGEILVALERRTAGQHLESRAGEGVEVRPAVDRAALDLLGRHVVDRPEELAGAGQADRGHRQFAEPEV